MATLIATRAGRVSAAVGLLLLAATQPASAAPRALHASLLSSRPAAGATLVSAPAEIRLVFSEPIEPALSAVTLLSANGDSTVLAPSADPHDVHAVIAPVPARGAGTFTVRWRVVSADGHRVDGSFWYRVGGDAGAAIAPAPRSDSAVAMSHHEANPPPRDRLVPSLRAIAVTMLMATAGLVLMIATLPISGPRPMRLAAVLSALTVVLLTWYFVAWSVASVGGGRSAADAVALAASSTPGALEIVRIALALLALWALALARRAGLAAVFAGLAVLITGASGHPAAIQPLASIPTKSLHLAAASLWLGGLLWIVSAERHGARYVDGTRRISSLALTSVAVVVATGIVQSLLFLPRFAALFDSLYGQLILAKAAGLGLLLLFGAFNRRIIPRLETTMARRRLRRSVRAEIVVMLVVSILGGLLAAISPDR